MTKHLIHENCTLNVKMQELSTAASNVINLESATQKAHKWRNCN